MPACELTGTDGALQRLLSVRPTDHHHDCPCLAADGMTVKHACTPCLPQCAWQKATQRVQYHFRPSDMWPGDHTPYPGSTGVPTDTNTPHQHIYLVAVLPHLQQAPMLPCLHIAGGGSVNCRRFRCGPRKQHDCWSWRLYCCNCPIVTGTALRLLALLPLLPLIWVAGQPGQPVTIYD